MRTDELKEALTAAVSTVDTLPGFTDRVVHGGRRRRRRRRLLVLATALSTVLALALGTVVWDFLGRFRPEQFAADARFGQHALGGRAGDTALSREAVAVFDRDWPRSRLKSWYSTRMANNPSADLLGGPHVYWAGETPAGPAVVLLHRVVIHSAGGREGTMLSLVGRDARTGQVRLLGVDVPREPGAPAGAFLFGPGDRTLLAVDQGRPAELSAGLAVAGDGVVTRDRARLAFGDGVSLSTLPETAEPVQSVLTLADGARLRPQLASEHVWHLDLPPDDPTGMMPPPRQVRGINWQGNGGPLVFQPSQPFFSPQALHRMGTAELLREPYLDPYGEPQPIQWELMAGLAGDRSLYLTEIADGGPTRLYGVVFRPDRSVETVRFGGHGEPSALPVRLRLPGDEGWVVAKRHAGLRWRTGPDAAWQAGGRDAAVLPGNAREVEVTVDGRTQVVALG
ncbi:hypothetical protein M8C13_29920 [Crossiella sp. SN42]|uniref:hypothetical protein n=1 Tax=Crossiella sp. SN42 TaxID=2944808 RepID=UPI00207C9335|nr:hypothetical protein [Crossiella sp. SN42]MCO1579978.1 hypothetical protein [Crossiella sp. SN42]